MIAVNNNLFNITSIGALCLLAMMRSSTYAGDTQPDSRSVQTIWIAKLGLGFITASITNKNSYPIRVDPLITVRYSNTLSLLTVPRGEKDVFRVVILFAPVPPQGQPTREGVYPFPIAIEPGVTKNIDFQIDPDVIALVKSAKSATLFLQFDQTIFGQITLDNVHDALNAKRIVLPSMNP